MATGDVEFAVAPMTTILSKPGVKLAAVFPEDFGTDIHLSVFLSMSPEKGASTILEFLTSDEVDRELEIGGMMRFEASD